MKKNYTTIAISKSTKELINAVINALEESIKLNYTCDEIINRMFKKYSNAFINAEIRHYIKESPLDPDELNVLESIEWNKDVDNLNTMPEILKDIEENNTFQFLSPEMVKDVEEDYKKRKQELIEELGEEKAVSITKDFEKMIEDAKKEMGIE